MLSLIGFLFLNRYPYLPPGRRYRDTRFWVGVALWVAYGIAMLLLFCSKFYLHP